ncbi:hypothetical protein EG355_11880 [Serratia marcescens]|uniref:hypothetical protein n=1 Tax=Serratia marcescens TaxID=615 RepID=UPI0010379E01|nr:hypothetical protein [Serratia marcescens]TBU68502.1 hypothetical protein EG355_11880 [Serratia marcescens]
MKDENDFWEKAEAEYNKTTSHPPSNLINKGKALAKWVIISLTALILAFFAIIYGVNRYDSYKSDENYKYKLTLQKYETKLYSFKNQNGVSSISVFKPVNGGEIIYNDGNHYYTYYGDASSDGWPNEVYGYYRPIKNWNEILQVPEFKSLSHAEKEVARHKYIKARLDRGLPDDTY